MLRELQTASGKPAKTLMSHRFTMPIDHRETRFEDTIKHHLLNNAGYAKAVDRECALDPTLFSLRS